MKDERRLPRETNPVTENPRTITEDNSHENLTPALPPTQFGHTPVISGRQWYKGDTVGGEAKPAKTSYTVVEEISSDGSERTFSSALPMNTFGAPRDFGLPDPGSYARWRICSGDDRLYPSWPGHPSNGLIPWQPIFAPTFLVFLSQLKRFHPPDCSISSYTKDRRESTVWQRWSLSQPYYWELNAHLRIRRVDDYQERDFHITYLTWQIRKIISAKLTHEEPPVRWRTAHQPDKIHKRKSSQPCCL